MGLDTYEPSLEEKEVTEQEFEAGLLKQEQEFMESIGILTTEKISLTVMLNMDRTKGLSGAIEFRFFREMKAQTEEIKAMHREKPDLAQAYLLKQHEIKLGSLKKRAYISMEINTGDSEEISTAEEAIQMAKILEQVSLEDIDLLGRIHDSKGGKLKTEDLDLIGGHLMHLQRPGKGEPIGLIVMHYLVPEQRQELLLHMAENPVGYPNLDQIVSTLVAANYLYIAQGQEILAKAAENFEKNKGEMKRRDRREVKHDVERYSSTAQLLDSDVMRAAQAHTVQVQKQQVELTQHRQYGHKNPARDVFSLKGIASAFLVANGALATAGNILVNPSFSNIGNPYLYAGIVTAGVGLQLSNGFGGILPTPLEGLGAITKDTDEKNDKTIEKVNKYAASEINNNPIIARFYYKYADKIVGVYQEKRKTDPEEKIHLTFEDLDGVDYETLPTEYKRYLSKETLETTMTKWVKFFSRESIYGQFREGYKEHRALIDEVRKEAGIIEKFKTT